MLRPWLALTLLAALVVSACAQNARPPEAPVDLTIPPLGKANATPPREPVKSETCHARIMAGPISKSSFGCVVDEHITRNEGILTYPCLGTGDAEAHFGDQSYAGTMREGELDLEAKTELEWPGDGCRWGTTANIRGRPSGDRMLAWTYRDYVLRGQACSGSCTATSTFAVRRTADVKHRDDDDDDIEDDDAP